MSNPPKLRSAPYVWATWLSKILAGEDHCHWSTWFRAHYFYNKQYSDFDKQNWMLHHTRLVDECARQLEMAEYSVSLEGQNSFQLRGSSGVVLAGCPDIVARKGDELLIVDCKTGKRRISHEYQVLIYMLSLPFARPAYKPCVVTGLVYYKDDSLFLTTDRLDERLRSDFRYFMKVVGGTEPPRRVPSLGECRFCDLGSDYCPDRLDGDQDAPVPADELF